ncbi:hypothetical protein AVEN_106584-1 [Araneus ventricosus]|uniref:Uncharacterized protein n=1 Tax=Araneus ventricosus TaxID=182803 RepID=A0A4Y2DI65_ARAVE|nr:hypothetical protein AVEN_106584-1 [Araneus ventricosus]
MEHPHGYGGSRILNQHLKRWISRREMQRCFLLCTENPLFSVPLATEISGLDTAIFSMGLCERQGVCASHAQTIEELKVRICNALASVSEQMLQNVWREMDYGLDVVRVTKGSHVEHL